MTLPHGWEIVFLAVILLLLFGGRKLPEMARSLGASIKSFRKEMSGAPDEASPQDPGTQGAPTASPAEPGKPPGAATTQPAAPPPTIPPPLTPPPGTPPSTPPPAASPTDPGYRPPGSV